ncbi:xylose repressor [Mycobacterium antarcticum]|uniref:ROK family transcriptional regulator n=1 Tax=Mycolicibacterium sp. TUM20983 TaxID=3023369 RepID=UPI00239834CF|nr:ROK family transcriptional regulator [Mycolicibacterium sp. TUM20983]GLP78278.1 xylose repressor [Mycolicibacterium sp. TUM20983]
MSPDQRSAAQQRWFGAAQLIGLVRGEPGITRASAAQRLGIGTGGAADLVARLRRARLLDETPAPATGRGRPTAVLGAHPSGPLVLAADLRAGDWRLAIASLDGQPRVVAQAPNHGNGPARLLSDMRDAITAVHREEPERIAAVAVSVAGTVSDARLGQFTTRGWTDVDPSVLTADLPGGVPLLVGNDATLAGLAEARTGAARGATTALHLLVAVGLGGTLVVDGEPVTGAHGAAGEYGHVPFGNRKLLCPCGARGCWDLDIDGRALARELGEQPPADPVGYAYEVLARPFGARRRQALESVAEALGAGIGGLVNLHDPEVVTLGGLAVPLRAAAPQAFDDGYRDGLMAFRKSSAPPVRDGIHGDDGPIRGAAALALDHVTTEAALDDWASRVS